MVDFPWGEVFLEGENHTQIKINYPPHILQLCGQVCLIRILVEKVRSFLYLIVLNMELHCYVNVCPKFLKRQSKHASMPVKGNNHEIRHPNSTSNHNRKPMEM